MSADMDTTMETNMQEPMEIYSFYTTKDFNLAAFLWAYKLGDKHADMEDYTPTIEGAGKPILYFKFRLPLFAEDVRKLVMRYMNGDCLVEPRAFASNQGKLKDIIYQQKS